MKLRKWHVLTSILMPSLPSLLREGMFWVPWDGLSKIYPAFSRCIKIDDFPSFHHGFPSPGEVQGVINLLVQVLRLHSVGLGDWQVGWTVKHKSLEGCCHYKPWFAPWLAKIYCNYIHVICITVICCRYVQCQTFKQPICNNPFWRECQQRL